MQRNPPPLCSKRFKDGKAVKLLRGQRLCDCTVTCHVNGLVHLDVTAEGKEVVLSYLGLIEAVVLAQLETQACRRIFHAHPFACCFFDAMTCGPWGSARVSARRG